MNNNCGIFSRKVSEPVEYTCNMRLNETKAAASLNRVSASTIVESREGTGISLTLDSTAS